ncbi:MAG: response regulator [Candidatus Nanopelagicales bacterium]|nr:response regulator [Candidatus Nanopelagicales bacterium]
MRPTRLLYVENDSALRRILGEMLGQSKELEILGSFAKSDDVLNRALVRKADVALIDFALDQNGLNGIELGIALRNINEYIGIVIYSQYSVSQMVSRVPKAMRSGWSFFDKSAEMSIEDYVDVIKLTSSGKGNWENVSLGEVANNEVKSSIYFQLTPRQRSIMSLSAQGKSAQDIALQLDLSYSYVRKELSRSYAVLLPEAAPSDDLKTAAVLRYMELMRMS